jgi:16S rRNA C1402 N4-methylase RsmH
MLRHPPVMIRGVVQAALQGGRWRAAKRTAERIAVAALVKDAIPVDPMLKEIVMAGSLRNAAWQQAAQESKRAPEASAEIDAADGAADALADLLEQPVELTSSPSNSARARRGRGDGNDALVPVSNALMVQNDKRFMDLMKTHGPPDALMHITAGQVPRLVKFDVLDCTLGGGHHTAAILEEGDPYTRVVALDCDHAVKRTAAAMKETFGPSRFQFFPNRMSQALELFGESSFDCVLIDPGPNVDQLCDLARGFTLQPTASGEFVLDMRYGPDSAVTAANWLQQAYRSEVVSALTYYGNLPERVAGKFATAIERYGPVTTTGQLLWALKIACPDPHEEGANRESLAMVPTDKTADNTLAGNPWLEPHAISARRRPFAHRVLSALRCVVNNERTELLRGLHAGIEVLRAGGRIVVMTRQPWEAELVEWFATNHPFAIVAQKETIDLGESKETLQPPETTVWTLHKTRHVSFRLKNAMQPPDSAELERNFINYVSGALSGRQTKGFPADRFSVGYHASEVEQEKQRAHRKKMQTAVPNNGRGQRVRLQNLNRIHKNRKN